MGGLSSNSECQFDGYVGDQRGSDLDLIGNRSGSGVANWTRLEIELEV